MNKGGYQILDLRNVDHTSDTAQTLGGAYELLEATHKPIYVRGVVVDGVEQRDGYVDFVVDGTSYVGTLGNYTITISDDDNVSVSATNSDDNEQEG